MARPWPLLINAQPVRSSLNKEPIVGTVIMGRQMDNQFIIRVSEQTDLPISLYRVDDEELPVAARSAVRELEAALSHPRGREPPVLVRALDRERIAGHALLRDVDGRSAMLVRVEIPRDIFAQGWYATWYIGFAIAGVGLFFGLMLLFLLQKFVLGRLSNLTEAVDRIAASGNRVARVAVSGKDEITGLQREINRMLEGLERGAADLERSEHFLRRMIETSPIGIITFDAKGLLTAANPAGLKIFGVEKQDDALGYWLFEDPNIPDDIKRQVREGRTVFYEAWYEFELIHRRRLYRSSATGRIYVDAVITPMSADNGREPSGFLLQISDATRRKLVEEDLRQSYAELKRLSAHIQSVREEERTRIARQIHDELGQLLMALKIDIVWMEKRIGAGSAPLVEKMAAVRKNMDTIAEVVEKISLELRPSVLDRLGLAAAVEWQGQEFARKTGIACRVAVDLGRLELDDERATAIFRIVQEALTNVARHAQATVVGLSLRFADRTLVLEISDNGRGIPPEAIHSAESFGLVQIRERAEFCGGQADFGPGADGGTRVRVTIPIILRAAEAAAP